MASFFHNPINGDILVSDLSSHSETEEKLKLNLKVWDEGHYLPNGEIECRVKPDSKITQEECNERLKNKFPTFVSFFNWAVDNGAIIGGSLDLSGCDLKGIKLPDTVGGWLYLSGCDLKGIKLPKTVGGSLDLSGCDLKGIKLPKTVGGWLDLSGCDLKGIKLPKTVGGSLYLKGCDLKGIKLPENLKNKVIK